MTSKTQSNQKQLRMDRKSKEINLTKPTPQVKTSTFPVISYLKDH